MQLFYIMQKKIKNIMKKLIICDKIFIEKIGGKLNEYKSRRFM